jgi:hypothetical protein
MVTFCRTHWQPPAATDHFGRKALAWRANRSP